MFFETCLGVYLNLDQIVSFDRDRDAITCIDTRGKEHTVCELGYEVTCGVSGQPIEITNDQKNEVVKFCVSKILRCGEQILNFEELDYHIRNRIKQCHSAIK